MSSKDNPVLAVCCMLLGLLLLASGKGCDFVGGGKAPFATDKLSVLIVEETGQRGQLTSTQLDALLSTAPGSVRDIVDKAGGSIRLLDKDQEDFSDEEPWVKAAWEAWKASGGQPPWIEAADARTGFAGPVTTEGDVIKQLAPLGAK